MRPRTAQAATVPDSLHCRRPSVERNIIYIYIYVYVLLVCVYICIWLYTYICRDMYVYMYTYSPWGSLEFHARRQWRALCPDH